MKMTKKTKTKPHDRDSFSYALLCFACLKVVPRGVYVFARFCTSATFQVVFYGTYFNFRVCANLGEFEKSKSVTGKSADFLPEF